MPFFLIQLMGFGAVALYLVSFQLKKRKQIVAVTCVCNVLYVVQYTLLGAYAGAMMDAIATGLSFCAAGKKKSKGPALRWVTMGLLVLMVAAGVVAAWLQRNWMELLPMAGALLQSGGLWFDDEQTIRKLGLAGTPFWLVYNCFNQAYGAAIGTGFTMISIAVALIRYRKKKA